MYFKVVFESGERWYLFKAVTDPIPHTWSTAHHTLASFLKASIFTKNKMFVPGVMVVKGNMYWNELR